MTSKKAESWLLQSCKFATDWHGPLPEDSYGRNLDSYGMDKTNPYDDLISGFNPSKGTIDLGNYEVQLSPEQVTELTRRLEKDLRRQYVENMLDEEGEVAEIARKEAKERGIVDKDLDFSLTHKGLQILDGKFRQVAFLSNQEIADKYGLVVPDLLDEPARKEEDWSTKPSKVPAKSPEM